MSRVGDSPIFIPDGVSIDIKDQLTIKVGKASITMKKNGDITINGKTINVKGSGNIVMKASKILEN